MHTSYFLKIMRLLLWGGIFLLLLFTLLLASLQTRYVREQIRLLLIHHAEERGLSLSIEEIGGSPPMRWTARGVALRPSADETLVIEELRFSLSFLPLLKKEIAFNKIVLHGTHYTFSGSAPLVLPNLALPFSLSVKSLNISAAQVDNVGNGSSAVYSLSAKGRLKKRAEEFFLDAAFTALSTPDASLELHLLGSRKKEKLHAEMRGNLPSFAPLYPLYLPSFDADLSLAVEVDSSWGGDNLKGQVSAHLRTLKLEGRERIEPLCHIEAGFASKEADAIDLEYLMVKGTPVEIDAEGVFDRKLYPHKLRAELLVRDLSLLSPELLGECKGSALYTPDQLALDFSTDHLTYQNHLFESLTGSLTSSKNAGRWDGKASLQLQQEQIALTGSALFDYSPLELHLKEFTLEGSEALISGEARVALNPLAIDGGFYCYLPHLGRFAAWAPGGQLGGSLAFTGSLSSVTSSHFTLLAKKVNWEEVYAHEVSLEAELDDLWHSPRGKIHTEATKLYLTLQSVKQLSFDACSGDAKRWQFALFGEGEWKSPFLLSAKGVFDREPPYQLAFDAIEGSCLGHPFQLSSPFTLSWDSTGVHLTPLQIRIAEGALALEGTLTSKSTAAAIRATHLPLDLLALSSPELALAGSCSLEGSVKEEASRVQGSLSLLLEEAQVYQAGKRLPLRAKGNLQLNLDNQVLQIHSDVKASAHQFFEWSATLPVSGSLFPWSFKLDRERPIASEAVVEGRLEKIFDFINMGSHKVSGLLSSRLYLSHTLADPRLVGKIDLQEGTYENYVTGTTLKKIYATARAENAQVELCAFTAEDSDEGKLQATGALKLDAAECFPFSIRAQLDRLNTLNYDTFSSLFTGTLSIEGDRREAFAKGALSVAKAEFDIPDQLPVTVPVLDITYVHPPPQLKKNTISSPLIYPVDLDISLFAPGKIYVRGRGLNSEWEGDVHLGGSNLDLAANGTLSLVKGEFVFSGKVFSLTQGEITFAHKKSQEAFLSLSGTLNLPDVTITAILRGPLASPQLTFQSMPAMPTSSILARILFNKDISEITAIQAIQLAQAIVTLSGGAGPDVLEKIRKSLGVDRLNIVSSPTGGDEITVQIGKYLIRGVMVTLSQSADSSQVLVEVELSKEFIFQAETQEEQEGKFTLKWNRNY